MSCSVKPILKSPSSIFVTLGKLTYFKSILFKVAHIRPSPNVNYHRIDDSPLENGLIRTRYDSQTGEWCRFHMKIKAVRTIHWQNEGQVGLQASFSSSISTRRSSSKGLLFQTHTPRLRSPPYLISSPKSFTSVLLTLPIQHQTYFLGIPLLQLHNCPTTSNWFSFKNSLNLKTYRVSFKGQPIES